MAKVPERQEIQHESPVNEVNRIRRYDDRHDQKRRGECRQLNVAPEFIAVLPFPQVLADRADFIAEETQKNIAPRIFGLAVVAVPVDRYPVNRVTFFILPVRVPLVMLHMHAVVHRLRKTTSDGLSDSKKAIEKLRSEKRVMNEVVPDAIDVRIHHQRVNEPENQHHPQRRVRKQKVERQKVSEMEKPRSGWNGIPACVREELGIGGRAFYSDRVSSHGPIGLGGPGTLADNRDLAR